MTMGDRSTPRARDVRVSRACRALAAVWLIAGGLVARADGQGPAPVEPIGPDAQGRWSFRNHVVPVLTRSGCNMGSCHGAAAGKNGLRLSLRGYAPELDHAVLTRQAGARRVNTAAPAESLMLLKATGALEHGGGQRFAPDSLEYRIVSEWIADGAPGPSEADPSPRSIAVEPHSAGLEPGQTQPLRVIATYSDGRRVDVTRWARFESTDVSVAKVDEHGLATVVGPGEGAIAVAFSGRVDLARIAVPYPGHVDPARFDHAPRANFIDDKTDLNNADSGVPLSQALLYAFKCAKLSADAGIDEDKALPCFHQVAVDETEVDLLNLCCHDICLVVRQAYHNSGIVLVQYHLLPLRVTRATQAEGVSMPTHPRQRPQHQQ